MSKPIDQYMVGLQRGNERMKERVADRDLEIVRLRSALQLIADGVRVPEAFPGSEGFELAAKSAMLIARAGLEGPPKPG